MRGSATVSVSPSASSVSGRLALAMSTSAPEPAPASTLLSAPRPSFNRSAHSLATIDVPEQPVSRMNHWGAEPSIATRTNGLLLAISK